MVIAAGKNGKSGDNEVVAAFPVAEHDEIMLVTDGGQLIRCARSKGIRTMGRETRAA